MCHCVHRYNSVLQFTSPSASNCPDSGASAAVASAATFADSVCSVVQLLNSFVPGPAPLHQFSVSVQPACLPQATIACMHRPRTPQTARQPSLAQPRLHAVCPPTDGATCSAAPAGRSQTITTAVSGCARPEVRLVTSNAHCRCTDLRLCCNPWQRCAIVRAHMGKQSTLL